MINPGTVSDSNILNLVVQDIIVSTGSPFAQSPDVEEGWHEYTRTVSAHENGEHRASDFSGVSEKRMSGLSDWERYYGETSSQSSTTRVLSPPPSLETSRQSNLEDTEKENTGDYPTGLQLALIILGVCLSVYIIALNRQIVSTV